MNILPHKGYILCKRFVQPQSIYKSLGESVGEDQKSEVIAVGEDILDSNNILRTPDCKVGDIIIHADSNKTFEIDHEMYRFVHFSEIHGIWEDAPQEAKN